MKTSFKISPRPDPVAVKVRQISDLLVKGDFDKAEAAAQALLQAHPKRPDVHNIMGIVFIQQKKRNKAIPHLEFACKAESQNPVYLNNLGRLYLDLNMIELALPFLHNALTINPNLSTTLLAIGEYYTSVGQAARALPYLERACRIDPNDKRAKFELAGSLDDLGRKDEVKRLFGELQKDPAYAAASLYHMSRNISREEAAPLVAEAEQLLKSDSLTQQARSSAHTALGFIFEKEGNHKQAFDHFAEANRLIPKTFSIEEFRAWVDGLIEVFTPDVFRERADFGSQSSLPVLVVGMPRSGTTLTEQIIASHGQAGGAGELTRIGLFARSLNYAPKKDIRRFLPSIDALGPQQISEMGENYVKLLQFHTPQAARVVDKLPHNFQNLGIFAFMCPNARVIHCARNPVDTCLSCFQNPLNEFHTYSTDLTSLGLYYREYVRLMKHWKEVLPIQIYELSYERLTADFEAEARKLIDFIGLPWDEACLKFYEGESTVRTFSKQQVRNPVYKSSVERWRRYETELQPLLSALGDLA